MAHDIICPPSEQERRRQERRRLLEMCALAVGIGVLGAAAAFALQAGLALCTNLFFFGRFSLAGVSPADNHLGLLVLLIPPLGGFLVGLLARYGSSSIRGRAPGRRLPAGIPGASTWPPCSGCCPRRTSISMSVARRR